MADVLAIVPHDLTAGFRLAGARAWTAESAAEAQALLVAALDDPRAGIVGVADVYYAVLDASTLQKIERHYRPVVVPVPTRAGVSEEQRRQTELQELIRRAIGLRIVLGGRPAAR